MFPPLGQRFLMGLRHTGPAPPQGRCLEAEDGGWAVDYLVTVENFDQQVHTVRAAQDVLGHCVYVRLGRRWPRNSASAVQLR